MVDLARELDGWAKPAAGHRWGWAAFAAGLRACIEHGRTSIRRADDAHQRICQSRDVSDETVSDLGLSREDILGEPTWQADLPFFMQRNFR
jgi:hypothetical protein